MVSTFSLLLNITALFPNISVMRSGPFITGESEECGTFFVITHCGFKKCSFRITNARHIYQYFGIYSK